MNDIVTLITRKPLCFIFSKIEHNGVLRLPKSGVRIVTNLKERYELELTRKYKSKVNNRSAFKVEIIVFNGKEDNLGTGDLDNYAKGILDIITKTNTVWNDDRQIDELRILRKKSKKQSEIKITINEI